MPKFVVNSVEVQVVPVEVEARNADEAVELFIAAPYKHSVVGDVHSLGFIPGHWYVEGFNGKDGDTVPVSEEVLMLADCLYKE